MPIWHSWDWVFAAIAAPFVGSFLSTLAVRLPQGEDVVLYRSHCRKCGKNLRPQDLVPVVSWAMARGRCHFCKEPIDLMHPVVEVAAIVVTIWAAATMDGPLFWVSCLLGWTLLALSAMDLRALILSDVLTLPLIATGLLAVALIDPPELMNHAIGAAAGFLVLWGVAICYRRIRGYDGLGLGDAKLFAAAGAWTSWAALGGVLLIASAVTLSAMLAVHTYGGGLNPKAAVPLGPGMALGFWLSWLYGPIVLA